MTTMIFCRGKRVYAVRYWTAYDDARHRWHMVYGAAAHCAATPAAASELCEGGGTAAATAGEAAADAASGAAAAVATAAEEEDDIADAGAAAAAARPTVADLRDLAEARCCDSPVHFLFTLAGVAVHERVTVITQNVDGLHRKAGSSAARVVEIHGTMQEVLCMQCHERAPMERALERVRAGEEDPPCRSCGGILKSATISFGQGLVAADLQRAFDAANRCDLMLAVGTTLAVYPVAGIVPEAKQNGARVVILNGEATEMDSIADAVLRGPIGQLLPRLITPLS